MKQGHTHCIAHRRPGGEGDHNLADHLAETGDAARHFASLWGAGDVAALTGLWHDFGKHSPAFQSMIRSAQDDSGHLEGPAAGLKRRVDHSTAGALHACRRLGTPGLTAAFVIAGHHAGLPDFQGASGLKDRLERAEPLLAAATGMAKPGILNAGNPQVAVRPPDADPSLWIRMLASAVFDADFLNTEEFFDPGRSDARTGWAPMASLSAKLDARLAGFAGATGEVNRVRAEILCACREAAKGTPGLHSLTVPTGGGKTLSSLAFALDHARNNNLRRVIYAVPFTSIIEQTADIFRAILGKDAVLEHHSNLDPAASERENNRARLASENWDAPVIVTTTVQLFESLFASRTSRLRKLHNIARSVIILDEAQAIPADVLHPVTAVLAEITRTYKSTVVLCTATQPALGAVFRELPSVREIAPDPPALFKALDRVRVRFPAPGETRSWDDIALAMAESPQALAIVNSRADCRSLHEALLPGAVHLSTWQCAAHRAKLLNDVKAALKAKEPVRVVSTSLIEAGVDVSFPAVYRAMAGLDAIAQAAGRCNRENELPDKGDVTVFRPAGSRLSGHRLQAVEATEAVLRRHADAPFHPEAFEDFFRELYWSKDTLDRYGMGQLLGLGTKRRDRPWYDIAFRTAAARFRMIDDAQDSLVIRYDGRAGDAIEALRRDGPSRTTLRALQRYTVPVRPKLMARLRADGAVEDVADGVTVLVTEDLYDREGVGLMVEMGQGRGTT